MEYTYKQNELVNFEYGHGIKGIGIVKGAARDMPLIGRIYMVKILEADGDIVNDTFPFDTIPIAESQLEPLTPYEL
jgi:hypothetical protein